MPSPYVNDFRSGMAGHQLHKLRRAMIRQGREKLSGLVEFDEACIGGKETGTGRVEVPKKKV